MILSFNYFTRYWPGDTRATARLVGDEGTEDDDNDDGDKDRGDGGGGGW
jgi:hypothetical protein